MRPRVFTAVAMINRPIRCASGARLFSAVKTPGACLIFPSKMPPRAGAGASTSTELSSPANSICWRIVSRNGVATTSVIEEFAGSARIVDAMEEALGAVARENIATPDAGGSSSTNEVVDAVLTAIINPNRRTQEDLLIVVDMQGDFLAADGRCAQLGLIDSAKTSALATRVNWLLDAWRATGRPVAFTQTN